MKRRSWGWGMIIVGLVTGGGMVGADIPRTINIQARLTDQAGVPLGGTPSITFKLYSAPNGGEALFTDVQTVSATNGVISARIGEGPNGPIPVEYFNGTDVYLGMTVGTGAELTPRQKLVSVPYAFRASKADTAVSADTAASATNATNASHATSAGSADTAISATTAANANYATTAGSANSAVDAQKLGGKEAARYLEINPQNGVISRDIYINGKLSVPQVPITDFDATNKYYVDGYVNAHAPGGETKVNKTGDFMTGNLTFQGGASVVAPYNAVVMRAINPNGLVRDIMRVDSAGFTKLKPAVDGAAAVSVEVIGAQYFEVVTTGGPAATIDAQGNIRCVGSLYVNQVKNAIIDNPANPNERLVFTATESSRVLLEDVGEAALVNGVATISFREIFKLGISDQAIPFVQLTPLGECKGLFVEERTATGFKVRELQGGTSNVSFCWRAVSARRGFENVNDRREPKTQP